MTNALTISAAFNATFGRDGGDMGGRGGEREFRAGAICRVETDNGF